MKKIIIILSCVSSLLLLVACNNNNNSSEQKEPSSNEINVGNKDELPIIDFEEMEHDFGKIVQGEKVKYDFKFTNVGKGNLIISSAAASCGCTVADFPKEPIPPGKSGKITVEFNSEGKSGYVEKTITVVTNCEPNTIILKIKTDIVEPQK
jgi:major membrane immunogen (membrane-anchored lipoprotein)